MADNRQMNKTVLVVDDDDVLRDTLARGLRKNDFNILTSASTTDADNIMMRIIVDAIVLDRMMVGTDGLTWLKQLRCAGNQTPVIMLTAMTGPENTIAGLMGGANDYLAKPFQLQELVLRLNNIIKNNTNNTIGQMPHGLTFTDDEFFVLNTQNQPTLLQLSGEEKKLLHGLTTPVGNIVPAAPMVAKRLRNKINSVLSDLDILTVRGRGYKLIQNATPTENTKR